MEATVRKSQEEVAAHQRRALGGRDTLTTARRQAVAPILLQRQLPQRQRVTAAGVELQRILLRCQTVPGQTPCVWTCFNPTKAQARMCLIQPTRRRRSCRRRHVRSDVICLAELYSIEDPPEATLVTSPFADKATFRFAIQPRELSFSLQLNEPFFGTMALYDMTRKQKMSENFDFDVNAEGQLASLQPRVRALRQWGLFSVPAASVDVWLVIRIDKVLQADAYDAIVEPYSKADGLKEKDKDRLATAASGAAARLGRFRTPFVWTLLPLFGDDKQLALGLDAKVTSFYRWKAELGEQLIFDTYAEYNKTGSSLTKRTRTVPGRLLLDVQPWTAQLDLALSKYPRVDAEGHLVQSALELSAAGGAAPGTPVDAIASTGTGSSFGRSRSSSAPPSLAQAQQAVPAPQSVATALSGEAVDAALLQSSVALREVGSFVDDVAPVVPYTQVRHCVYVYPLSCAMAKVAAASGVAARNIVVQVQLMDTDDVHATPLPLCFTRHQVPLRADRVLASVHYHERSPTFCDELKLGLPLVLTTKHNLLFTFYHVACKDAAEGSGTGSSSSKDAAASGDEPLMTPVGYAFMPILFKGRVLEKEITLPIASQLPRGYMSAEGEAQLRQHLLDAKKVIFRFRLRLVSSLYTSDKHLNTFFTGADQPLQRGREPLRALLSVSISRTIQFLPTILNVLFYTMVRSSNTSTTWSELLTGDNKDSLAVDCFHVLIECLHRLHTAGEFDLQTALMQYVDHVFLQQPVAITSALYRVFTAAWAAVLEKAASHGQLPGMAPAEDASLVAGLWRRTTVYIGLLFGREHHDHGDSVRGAGTGLSRSPEHHFGPRRRHSGCCSLSVRVRVGVGAVECARHVAGRVGTFASFRGLLLADHRQVDDRRGTLLA